MALGAPYVLPDFWDKCECVLHRNKSRSPLQNSERREIKTYDAFMKSWWVPCRQPTGRHYDTHIWWERVHGGRRIILPFLPGCRLRGSGGYIIQWVPDQRKYITREKPFRCSQCSAAFTKKQNLQRHYKTHTWDCWHQRHSLHFKKNFGNKLQTQEKVKTSMLQGRSPPFITLTNKEIHI